MEIKTKRVETEGWECHLLTIFKDRVSAMERKWQGVEVEGWSKVAARGQYFALAHVSRKPSARVPPLSSKLA